MSYSARERERENVIDQAWVTCTDLGEMKPEFLDSKQYQNGTHCRWGINSSKKIRAVGLGDS